MDEVAETPDRMNLCHHFQNICLCSQSNLRIVDHKNRWQNCESSETLKYRLVRVGVDSVNLCVTIGEYSEAAILLESASIRFAYCNAHLGGFAENINIHIPQLEISQLICDSTPSNSNSMKWLKCGGVTLNEVHIWLRNNNFTCISACFRHPTALFERNV